MLANWQAENVFWIGQTEPIADHGSDDVFGCSCMTAHTAVFGEVMVFFMSGNSCQF